MAKRKFLTFRERLEKVYKSRDNVVFHLDEIDLQYQHFIENDFVVPSELLEKYNKAATLVDQFDEIIAEPSGTFKERRQRKAMLLTFEQIFESTAVQLRNAIVSAADCWNQQYAETGDDGFLAVYTEARDNIVDIDD